MNKREAGTALAEAHRLWKEALAEAHRLWKEALAEADRRRDEAIAEAHRLWKEALAEGQRIWQEALDEANRQRVEAVAAIARKAWGETNRHTCAVCEDSGEVSVTHYWDANKNEQEFPKPTFIACPACGEA